MGLCHSSTYGTVSFFHSWMKEMWTLSLSAQAVHALLRFWSLVVLVLKPLSRSSSFIPYTAGSNIARLPARLRIWKAIQLGARAILHTVLVDDISMACLARRNRHSESATPTVYGFTFSRPAGDGAYPRYRFCTAWYGDADTGVFVDE